MKRVRSDEVLLSAVCRTGREYFFPADTRWNRKILIVFFFKKKIRIIKDSNKHDISAIWTAELNSELNGTVSVFFFFFGNFIKHF